MLSAQRPSLRLEQVRSLMWRKREDRESVGRIIHSMSLRLPCDVHSVDVYPGHLESKRLNTRFYKHPCAFRSEVASGRAVVRTFLGDQPMWEPLDVSLSGRFPA